MNYQRRQLAIQPADQQFQGDGQQQGIGQQPVQNKVIRFRPG
jgi:hypothetical protein